jgi:hypothetical protein
VLLDGIAVRSCLTPVGKVAGRSVMTVEGLGKPDTLHPLQQAFIDTGSVQCGYCTPGMLIAAAGLLHKNLCPSRSEIIEALEGNLCRCTGYKRIIQAVELAAQICRGENRQYSMEKEVIGGEHRRVDAIDKVTGNAKFVEDISIPNLLHAKILRSPHHHARLINLDFRKAAELPGIVSIFSAQDIPGMNGFQGYSLDEPVLTPVGSTVRMLGAQIAIVVATSPELAQAGVEAIEAHYQLLPFTFDMHEALAKDSILINESGNVLSSFEVKHGEIVETFNKSDLTLDTQYSTSFLEHSALEGRLP